MEGFGDQIEVEVAGISRVISPNAELSGASKWSDDIKAGLPIVPVILTACSSSQSLTLFHGPTFHAISQWNFIRWYRLLAVLRGHFGSS